MRLLDLCGVGDGDGLSFCVVALLCPRPRVPDPLARHWELHEYGEEVTVTDHGKAVARLVPLDQPRVIDRLIAEGLISSAENTKQKRPLRRIRTNGTVSDLVAEQRQ